MEPDLVASAGVDLSLRLPTTAVDAILTSVIGVAIGFVGTRFERVRRRFGAKSIWGLADPTRVTIAVAHSASSHTGRYTRAATGIGQVRALAALMPSLSTAYRDFNVDTIRLSSEQLPERRKTDVVSLGGLKNNRITAEFLAELGDSLPVVLEDEAVRWRGHDAQRFEDEVVDGAVRRDFGLVVRARNPYARSCRLILIAGIHTYGTVAAAEFLVSRDARRRFGHRNFVAVLQASIRNGHPVAANLVRSELLGGDDASA